MSTFGIDGYAPRWRSGLSEVTAAHADRLRALAGRTLTRSWVVWDLDADSWWPDCPVLLDFGGEQLEVNHQKFDDLSITWNTIDPARAIDFPETRLVWRADTLEPVVGQRLRAVELLEWTTGDLADGMVAVGLSFTDDYLTIYNSLDENGIAFDLPEHCTRHPLGA